MGHAASLFSHGRTPLASCQLVAILDVGEVACALHRCAAAFNSSSFNQSWKTSSGSALVVPAWNSAGNSCMTSSVELASTIMK